MLRPPPRSTRTDTLFPYTTLFRSLGCQARFGLEHTMEMKSADARLRCQRLEAERHVRVFNQAAGLLDHGCPADCHTAAVGQKAPAGRSEERRVGKECVRT